MNQVRPEISIQKIRFAILGVGLLLFGLAYLAISNLRGDDGDGTEPPGVQITDAALDSADRGDTEDAGPDDLGPSEWRRGLAPSGTESVADVASELTAADLALAEGRLHQPENDNALTRYRNILAVAPDHEAAQDGFDTVVATLIERLRTHVAQREISAGAEIYRALRKAGAQVEELTALGDRLEALEKSAELMALASGDVQAGRLIEPAGRSAIDRLRRAASLDPTSAAIADRLVSLERQLIDEALKAARERRFTRADALIEGAQRARGGSSSVQQAREQISQFRNDLIEETILAARNAMRDSRFPAAETAIESVRSLGGDGELLASLDEELRLSRIYNVYRPGEVFSDPIDDSRHGPAMVVIPHGGFIMGARYTDGDSTKFELPAHPVNFQRGFALGQHEITVAQFREFVEATQYRTQAEYGEGSTVYNEKTGRMARRKSINWRHDYRGRTARDNDPVLHVSFNDAMAYAAWLSEATARSYRLPTEAEFEYAMRGGRQTRYWWGMDSPTLAVENVTGELDRSSGRLTWNQGFANYNDGFWGPAPVASLAANPYGLYDMAGNVQEWVLDCWHDSYVRAPSDGSAWINRGCTHRVVRGAFWGGSPETARVSARQAYPEAQRGPSIGFRVARDLVVIPNQIAQHQRGG